MSMVRPQLAPQTESKPAGEGVLSSQGQARADAGMSMLRAEDDGPHFV